MTATDTKTEMVSPLVRARGDDGMVRARVMLCALDGSPFIQMERMSPNGNWIRVPGHCSNELEEIIVKMLIKLKNNP